MHSPLLSNSVHGWLRTSVGSLGAPTAVWRPLPARPSRCRPTLEDRLGPAASYGPGTASGCSLQAALGREGQIVLHGADTRNSAGNLGGPGARADRLDLTRESDHARVHLGVDLRVLQLRILLEAILDALGDLLVVRIHRLAVTGRDHLELVLHALHAVDALGDFASRRLGLGVVDLPAQHDRPTLGLHVDLAALDAVVGEESDLRLGSDPRIAHPLLRLVRHALRRILRFLRRA